MSGIGLGQPYGYGLTFQQTVKGVNPAAGSSFSYPLKQYDRFRLIGIVFTLTVAAGGSDRYVTVEYSGPTADSIMADAPALVVSAPQAATRWIGSLSARNDFWNTGTDVFFPLSGLWLEAGRTVAVNVANIGASDTLTKIYLTFDIWPGRAWIPAQTDEGA